MQVLTIQEAIDKHIQSVVDDARSIWWAAQALGTDRRTLYRYEAAGRISLDPIRRRRLARLAAKADAIRAAVQSGEVSE